MWTTIFCGLIAGTLFLGPLSAHAQFEDWTNLGPIIEPDAYYEPPSYLPEPYQPSPDYGAQSDALLNSFLTPTPQERRAWDEQKAWSEQMYRNRCSGQNGVDVWGHTRCR
jgi:hypothetical protein